MDRLTTRVRNYEHSNKVKMTDLHLRIFASYLTATGVGSGSLQYQWMVLSVTNFAQVLSFGWVLEKIFSRKLNSSRSTYGRRLTVKKKDG